jgi:endogenous inhibitor of DNA gyrase (YacG/DUF329 family)
MGWTNPEEDLNLENKCHYCGKECEKAFCSTQCEEANLND